MAVVNRTTQRTAKKTAAPKKTTPKPKSKPTAATNPPPPDPVDRAALEAESRIAAGIFYSVPEFQPIIEQGQREGWTKDRYTVAFQNTNWYRDNNQYARAALAAKAVGGADWDLAVGTARRMVQQRAAATGAPLTPEQLAALTDRAVMEGWVERGDDTLIDNALAEFVDYQQGVGGAGQVMRGWSGDFAEQLRSKATMNGLGFSEDFYRGAARSVMSGLTTEDDWLRDIQEQAAGLYPVYADKIRAGLTVRQLASPYLTMMAQELEIDPESIKLDDPYIRSALGAFDQGGNPQAMNLWDFQKKLREDPRWENTAKAQNEITGVTGRVMQMFGLMGG